MEASKATFSTPFSIEGERLLLVEGRSDERFFRRLCRHLGIQDQDMQIRSYGGKHKLPGTLRTLPALPNFEMLSHLGITRDADNDASAAHQSIRSSLNNAQLVQPRYDGVIRGDRPKVSVMILPPGHTVGCLETVLWEAIEDEEKVRCIKEFVDCSRIPAEDLAG